MSDKSKEKDREKNREKNKEKSKEKKEMGDNNELDEKWRFLIGGILVGTVLDFKTFAALLLLIWFIYNKYTLKDVRDNSLEFIRLVRNEINGDARSKKRE